MDTCLYMPCSTQMSCSTTRSDLILDVRVMWFNPGIDLISDLGVIWIRSERAHSVDLMQRSDALLCTQSLSYPTLSVTWYGHVRALVPESVTELAQECDLSAHAAYKAIHTHVSTVRANVKSEGQQPCCFSECQLQKHKQHRVCVCVCVCACGNTSKHAAW